MVEIKKKMAQYKASFTKKIIKLFGKVDKGYCGGKFFKIPKRDFIFARRISPRSEFFLGHIKTGILYGGLIYG